MESFKIPEQQPGVHFSPGPAIYNQTVLAGDPEAAIGIFKPSKRVDANAVMAALKIKLSTITLQEEISCDDLNFFSGELRKYQEHLTPEFIELIEGYFIENDLQPCLDVINEIRSTSVI